jgi:tetratricopeptide (TPR) repeat protein
MPRFQPLSCFAGVVACLALAFYAGCTSPTPPKTVMMTPVAGGELDHALALRNAKRYTEATPLYETWLAAHPKDAEATFDFGYTLYLQAGAETRPDVAKALRLRARQLALKARKLGSQGILTIAYDAAIDAEGKDLRKYHTDAAIEQRMHDGEAAFARGDFAAAIAAYQAALALDPKLYTAALFIGDTCFNQHDFAHADEWFAKAVVLDPDRETAHRYWADSLMKQGRADEARAHYCEAVVAEPYNRTTREMLARYARVRSIEFHQPAIKRFNAGARLDGKKVTLLVDKDPDAITLVYALARAAWLTEERPKQFPQGGPDRHCLAEETYALRNAITMAREVMGKDPALDAAWKPTLDELAGLDRAGLLEAYVLLDAADDGLAQDYATYRREHRDLLRRYIDEIWLGKA